MEIFNKDMKELNKAQVTALFEREAVLIGESDCIPEHRAVALFGKKAVKHAQDMNGSKRGLYVNGYGIGDYTMNYLTFRGFQAAASFHNIEVLREEARA